MGIRVVELAFGVLRAIAHRPIVQRVLHRLVAETGLTAALAVWARGHAVLVDKLEGSDFIPPHMDFGFAISAHSSAIGKALLQQLAPDELDAFIKQYGLPQLTGRTIVSAAKLRQELEMVRLRGYATSDREHFADRRGVAAAVTVPSRGIRAAVGVTGVAKDATWEQLEDTVRSVKEAALTISRLWSHRRLATQGNRT
jgi:IclR family acetate operon transcriptional repressor